MEIVYWIILIVWIAMNWIYKKDSGFSMKIALACFVIAAALTVFNFRVVAEPVMKISFIGWMIGIFQAISEYVRKPK